MLKVVQTIAPEEVLSRTEMAIITAMVVGRLHESTRDLQNNLERSIEHERQKFEGREGTSEYNPERKQECIDRLERQISDLKEKRNREMRYGRQFLMCALDLRSLGRLPCRMKRSGMVTAEWDRIIGAVTSELHGADLRNGTGAIPSVANDVLIGLLRDATQTIEMYLETRIVLGIQPQAFAERESAPASRTQSAPHGIRDIRKESRTPQASTAPILRPVPEKAAAS